MRVRAYRSALLGGHSQSSAKTQIMHPLSVLLQWIQHSGDLSGELSLIARAAFCFFFVSSKKADAHTHTQYCDIVRCPSYE